MSEYIEDEDGAPYPSAYVVQRPDEPFYLPYPGGRETGSAAAAFAVVNPNRHLGWEVVEVQLVPVKRGERACEGKNSNVCVAEGCHGESCRRV